jgi:phytoene desaturase
VVNAAPPSRRPVFIIGAGLAGLAAGCYCQMNGYQTRIFERHSAPGGVAATWRRGPYTVDGGIHFVMGHRPGQPLYDLYRELGAFPAAKVRDLNTFGRFLDQESGRRLSLTGSVDDMAFALRAFSPADVGLTDKLISGTRSLARTGVANLEFGRAPELAGPTGTLKMLWQLRAAAYFFVGPYARPMRTFAAGARDPVLRRALENLFFPEVPVWFVMMLLALASEGQLGLLEGGSEEFVRAIADRYTSLGGEIIYGAHVEEILVNEGRATGVRLAGGNCDCDGGASGRPGRVESGAGAVVSAADGHSTIFGMLGGRYTDATIRRRYATWPLIRPYVMVSFGVAAVFDDLPPFTTVALARPLDIGGHSTDTMVIRVFNYTSRFAPPGKTVIQAEFESTWDFWNDLRHADPAAYAAEKRRVADLTLDRLEGIFPGIAAKVEMTDVATPYTTWRYTRNREGAFEGWLPTPSVIMTPIRRTLPGLRDFYMAGQWVVPGGGVPPCLISGRDVAEMLCRRDGRRFGSGGAR